MRSLILTTNEESYSFHNPEINVVYLNAYMYPEQEAYRNGPAHINAGAKADIDLGTTIRADNARIIYDLDPKLVQRGVILSGVYMSEKTNTLHAVIYNPTDPNLFIDNGTPIVTGMFIPFMSGDAGVL